MRMFAVKWWPVVVRWSRVALALALTLVVVGWIEADQKVATLERQRAASTERGVRTRARISTLERRVAGLDVRMGQVEGAAGLTTPTATTVAPRRRVSPITPPPRVAGSTSTTVRPRTTTPRPCRVFIPITHQCVLVSVTIGPPR